MSEHVVRRWVKLGFLHRLHRGVYAFGNPRLVSHGRLFAAWLATGGRSFLSHRTCAGIYRLRTLNLHRIELTVPARAARGPRGLIVHRTATEPAPGEIRTYRGLRVSSLARMLVELAATESRVELERLMHEAARRRLLNTSEVAQAIERHRLRPGVAKLRAAFEAYRPRPDRRSDLERAFDRLLDEHPEIPQPQRNVRLGGWEIDCFWPAEGLALELDGRPYHRAVEDTERDRLKDTWLMRRDVRPLRVTDQRFEQEPDRVFADVAALLGLGGREPEEFPGGGAPPRRSASGASRGAQASG